VKTILVVDDDFPSLQVLDMVLTDQGYQVFTAWNGRDALQRVEEHPPDLILSDWMMPLMDGEAMCKALQANPAHQSIPIMIMTGLGASPIGDGCNVAEMIVKPFHLASLFETIHLLIGGASSTPRASE
jgi:CheY-like chemotaxis protein